MRIVMLIACVSLAINTTHADQLDNSLAVLAAAKTGGDQTALASAWQVAAAAPASDLPRVLSAMPSDNPLAQNWLRNAADAVLERSQASAEGLPTQMLRDYAADTEHPPRARRVAYEWLLEADAEAAAELRAKFIDDPDLELRYDAIADLIAKADAEKDEARRKELYQQAFASARDADQMSACVTALGQLGEKVDITQQMGYLTKWQIIGPFDNTGSKSFDVAYPPESEQTATGSYEGKKGNVEWQELTTTADRGLVDLAEPLDKEKGAIAYALATFESPAEMEADVRYTSHNATKVWINGELVAANNVYHSGGEGDQYVVPVKLKSGANTLLIKVCQNEQTEPWAQTWDFQLRICDHLGGKLEGVKQ